MVLEHMIQAHKSRPKSPKSSEYSSKKVEKDIQRYIYSRLKIRQACSFVTEKIMSGTICATSTVDSKFLDNDINNNNAYIAP